MRLTKAELRERVQTEQKWITTSRTDLFNSVPERKIRYVVAIVMSGDSAVRRARIEKLEEDGTTYTAKFDKVPVPADDIQVLGNYNIEDPLMVLEGGTKLVGSVDGNSISVTTIYYDDDI